MRLHTESLDEGLRAAGRIYLNSVFVEFLYDLCQTVFVEDGNEGSFDFFHCCMPFILFRLLLKDKDTIFICLFP